MGPMVICGVVCFRDSQARLSEIGVRDSKQLTRSKRERLSVAIKQVVCDFQILEVHPPEIDRENLNTIGVEKIAGMIKKFMPDRVYIDVPARGRGIERYCEKIIARTGNPGTEIIGENEADRKFPVVSAASILAKVHRDNVIDRAKEKCGDFGSGYPSDTKTIVFLEKYFADYGKLPEGIVRMKWRTVEEILKGKGRAVWKR